MTGISKWISVSAVAFVLGLGIAHSAWSIDVQVADAPTTDLQLTLDAINSANSSLYINIYELSSPEIADALLNRIQAGVQVQILEEGQPVGGMSAASKGIVSQLTVAMQNARSENRLYEMTSKAGGKRRFHYDHAKYAVIDETTLLIGSENYSPTGNPEAGSVGNRGWEVLIHDPDLAQQFLQIFQSDTDSSSRDVMDVTSSGVAQLLFDAPFNRSHPALAHAGIQKFPSPVTIGTGFTASEVQKITSPDTSESGLIGMIRSAQTSIDIEQMSFDPNWGTNGPQSVLLDEVLAAARRGVQVRVLLNDETVFDHPNHPAKPKNRVTVQILNDAASQGLPIQAMVANLKAMGVDYIHNKGVVLDGNKTLISSINWDENAVEKNREAAVLITSSDVYTHYEGVFEHDWEASGGSPNSGASTFTENFTTNGTADPVHCPDSIGLDVQIGPISIDSTEDMSLGSLANQEMQLKMARNRDVRGCILMTSGHVSNRKILEIRKDSHGETLFSIEGYTSDGKLYSIRARTTRTSFSNADLSAIVYDASGPAREKIGEAEIVTSVN